MRARARRYRRPRSLPKAGPQRRRRLRQDRVLVNNAAHQMSFESTDEISDAEWQRTFAVNISPMFYISKAAIPHMKAGSAIVNTASVNADSPNPHLLAYATTKGTIENFSAGFGAAACREGHPCERGRAGTGLDAPYSIYHAAGKSRPFRRAGADETSGTAARTGTCLRSAGKRRCELRFRCNGRRHRRQANHLRRRPSGG